ncbi:MAG: phosphate ABC transporter permease subunit PstC [Turicibacter sp.]|nr:phosphate ABC transporter permease subunit PstC [Turicibacter sp.]
MEKEMSVNQRRVMMEKLFHGIFFTAASIAVVSVALIIIFIFSRGLQPFFPGNEFGNYNPISFLTGLNWRPSFGTFGIGYMIVSSLLATLGAILLGVPIALLTAVFLAEVAPKRLAAIIQPAVELLAAIPSVLYGVFGFAIIAPAVRNISPYSTGNSLLAVILVLSIMILPTIASICTTSIRAVPGYYREGSLALGASKIQTIFKVVIPSAKSGILTAIVLGVGRAIGETMAVILVAGNSEGGIPSSIFSIIRPLTVNIALEMGYAAGMQQQMLFSTAVVLIIFIIIINLVLSKIQKKAG